MRRLSLIVLSLVTYSSIFSQTDKQKAGSLLREAITVMDNGDPDKAIGMLEEAKKLDAENYVYDYEIGFAYGLKKDHKNAIKAFERTLSFKNVTDQCYQMLANSYDHDGNPTKAIEIYNEGLVKFPGSGRLHLELGVMALAEKDYDKAIGFWEKGIEVQPLYASNYYRLSQLFAQSSEKIWAIFYGEMFLIMEPATKRSEEVSKIVFTAYQKSIDITSDTSAKVDFTTSTLSLNPDKKFELPFRLIYAGDFLLGMSSSLIEKKKVVDIEFLHQARSGFVDWWYKMKRQNDYPNIIIDFQKKIKDEGHMEAYNYWLLMQGEPAEFTSWYEKNESKMTAFIEWFNKNRPVISEKNFFKRPVD